jgi:hypothetical protein
LRTANSSSPAGYSRHRPRATTEPVRSLRAIAARFWADAM